MQTSVDGIYAAGDITGVEEASVAMEEGSIAGIAAAAACGCIDADKGKALTEPEGFAKMLEKASEMLVDCL